MRFAQDTSGTNRWQAPKEPLSNRGSVIPATAWPQRCPQGGNAPEQPNLNYTGTEDCLFLSVIAPANATNLPVYVTIRKCPMSERIMTNNE
jgi:carboxylesterase type B